MVSSVLPWRVCKNCQCSNRCHSKINFISPPSHISSLFYFTHLIKSDLLHCFSPHFCFALLCLLRQLKQRARANIIIVSSLSRRRRRPSLIKVRTKKRCRFTVTQVPRRFRYWVQICLGFYPHILKAMGPGILGNILRIPNKMVPSEVFFQSLFCTNGK